MALIGGVVVTHGRLSTELVNAAEIIVGEIHHITAVAIGWHDDVDVARDEIERAIDRVSAGAGVILLTDMFGGTPTNIAMTFSAEQPIEIVTGVNLPMLIKLASQQPGESLTELARRICEQGQKNIYVASDLLAAKKAK